MQLAATITSTELAESPSLGETITRLGTEFLHMKTSLREAQCEIARLRGELARLRFPKRRMPNADVAALRRQVAYHCHPDRGGDPELMSNLNTLFDFLERLEATQGGKK